jgi:hypothetical protein
MHSGCSVIRAGCVVDRFLSGCSGCRFPSGCSVISSGQDVLSTNSFLVALLLEQDMLSVSVVWLWSINFFLVALLLVLISSGCVVKSILLLVHDGSYQDRVTYNGSSRLTIES